MSKKINSRADAIAADQAMAEGITKHKAQLPASISVGSQTMTSDDLIALFQGRIVTAKAVVTADASRAAAIQADKTKRAQTRSQVSATRKLITAMFMQSPDTLGDFGLTVPKTPVRSAADKADAAAKGLATRKLLGTKGSQQKKAAIEAAQQQGSPPATSAQPAPAPAATVTGAGAAPTTQTSKPGS